MTLSNTMTSLMDKARELTGLSEKISLSRLTELMNHFDLHVNPNLLNNAKELSGEDFLFMGGKIVDGDGYKIFKTQKSWEQVCCFLTLNPGTYTLSENVSGPLSIDGKCVFCLQNADGSETLIANRVSIPAGNDEGHRVSSTFKVITKNKYRVFFTNVKTQSLPKLEAGDLATPFEKSGGG